MNKTGLDLNKIKDFLDSRFQVSELDSSIIEIDNKFGLPKTIYVNDKGEIWNSNADDGVFQAKTPQEVAKTIRTFTAKNANPAFKVSDMVKMVAPPEAALAEPELCEEDVVAVGSDVTKDILNEPEIKELCLPEDDQNEVAVMVFDIILASKNKELENYKSFAAKKIANTLNKTFENIFFSNRGEYLEVCFNNKFVSKNASKEESVEVLKIALSDQDLSSLYNESIQEFSNKVSKSLPDYFEIRDIIIAEVMEQLNEQKKDC